MANLFRQSALDRAASPERLDEAISIVSVRSWLLLVGVALMVAAALAWGLFGSIATRVQGHAIILTNGEVLGYFSALDGNRLTPGMAAQIAPRGVARAAFGAIRGDVQNVSFLPVTREHVTEHLNADLADVFFEAGPPIEARFRLQDDPASPSGLAWSSGPGPPFRIKPGTLAEVTITISEQAPITLVLPVLQRLTGS